MPSSVWARSYSRARVVPKNGGSSVDRVTGTPAAIIRGSGWALEARDDLEAEVAGQGHVAADLPLGEEPKDRLVLGRADPVLDPANLEVDHRLSHVLGARGLARVGHRRIAGGSRPIEPAREVARAGSRTRAPQADGDDQGVRLLFEQIRGEGSALRRPIRSGCRR